VKILLVVHQYPPFNMGGTEVYTRNLAAELHRCGCDVVLYFRADFNGRPFATCDETIDGVRARRVSAPLVGWRSLPLIEFYRTFLNPAIERDFAAFLTREQPDVVHFQHVMALSARLIPIARRMGFPVVLTLHDYWFLCSNSQLIWPDAQVCRGKALGLNCARCALAARARTSLMQPLRPIAVPLLQVRDALVRQAGLKANLLIAPSHFLIQQYVKAGFPADRFVYLENGIDVERIRRYPHRPPVDGRVRFTYLGSLAWQKGVHVAVEAFRGIPADKAVLRIYGDPTVFPEYTAHLHQLADPTNTFFEGVVPNEEVGRVLAETDVVVVPSLWYENSPVVIQEAFAAGVPVVASQLGALIEKVQDGCGVLCAPGDVGAWHKTLLSTIDRVVQAEAPFDNPPEVMTIERQAALLEQIYKDIQSNRPG
jgi:glycosyltransferase involved in cell wall biosynthesis